MKLESQPF